MTDDTNPSHAGRQAEALEGIAAAGREIAAAVAGLAHADCAPLATVRTLEKDALRNYEWGQARLRERNEARAEVGDLRRRWEIAEAEVVRLRAQSTSDHETYRSALDDAYGRLARLTDDSVREAFRTAYRDMGENREGYDEGVRRVLRIVEPDNAQPQIDASVPAERPQGESGGSGSSGTLGDRLRALVEGADPNEGAYESVDVGALLGLADEADRLSEARDLYQADANGMLQQKDQWRDAAGVAEAQVERVRAIALEYPENDDVDYTSIARQRLAKRIREALDGPKEDS